MIQATRKNKFTTELRSRTHTLLADVGEDLGGDDLGITPHEVLEASLAACTSITVQMYAARKAWPLESCDVLVSISSETKEGTVLDAKVHLVGASLSEEQKQRLLEIAAKCPVHKILTGPIKINLAAE
jgi:putative redox protein